MPINKLWIATLTIIILAMVIGTLSKDQKSFFKEAGVINNEIIQKIPIK